jgi:hypothetical protein
MKDLIEALTIFLKYSQEMHPTTCEHDELFVHVDPADVSDADKRRLAVLSFHENEIGGFSSFRFG